MIYIEYTDSPFSLNMHVINSVLLNPVYQARAALILVNEIYGNPNFMKAFSKKYFCSM
jgi:hypothetical protein